MLLQKIAYIPEDLQRDISRIFNAYNEGLSVEHFELLYNVSSCMNLIRIVY